MLPAGLEGVMVANVAYNVTPAMYGCDSSKHEYMVIWAVPECDQDIKFWYWYVLLLIAASIMQTYTNMCRWIVYAYPCDIEHMRAYSFHAYPRRAHVVCAHTHTHTHTHTRMHTHTHTHAHMSGADTTPRDTPTL